MTTMRVATLGWRRDDWPRRTDVGDVGRYVFDSRGCADHRGGNDDRCLDDHCRSGHRRVILAKRCLFDGRSLFSNWSTSDHDGRLHSGLDERGPGPFCHPDLGFLQREEVATVAAQAEAGRHDLGDVARRDGGAGDRAHHVMEVGMRKPGARCRRDAGLGQQLGDAGLSPTRGLRIAQFDQATREGAQTVQHAADLALRAVQTGATRPALVALLLVAGSAIITALVAVLTTIILARAAIVATRTTIIRARAAVICARTAVICARTAVIAALAVTWATVVTTLAITRAAIVATLAITRPTFITALTITRSAIVTALIVTRGGDITRRHLGDRGSSGGDIFGTGRRSRCCRRRSSSVERQGGDVASLAIGQRLIIRTTIATATATTTTTTLALLATFARLFTKRNGVVTILGAIFAIILVTLDRCCSRDGRSGDRFADGGQCRRVQEFWFAGVDWGVRRSLMGLDGHPIAGRGCGHGDRLGWLGRGRGSSSRRLGNAGLDGGLQCLDQFVAAESATVGDLVFACKLTQVFDGQRG